MDDARLARLLGWGTLLFEAGVLVALFRADHLFQGLPAAVVAVLWIGPVAVSLLATVLYGRLPADRRGPVWIAPVSLAILLLVPVGLYAWFLYDFGTHGPR